VLKFLNVAQFSEQLSHGVVPGVHGVHASTLLAFPVVVEGVFFYTLLKFIAL